MLYGDEGLDELGQVLGTTYFPIVYFYRRPFKM